LEGDTVRTYLGAFLLVGLGLGVAVHFVTKDPMPWWPDTAMIGAVYGTLAALSMFQHRRTNRLLWNALKGAFRRS
jgi:hypothetical protein